MMGVYCSVCEKEHLRKNVCYSCLARSRQGECYKLLHQNHLASVSHLSKLSSLQKGTKNETEEKHIWPTFEQSRAQARRIWNVPVLSGVWPKDMLGWETACQYCASQTVRYFLAKCDAASGLNGLCSVCHQKWHLQAIMESSIVSELNIVTL